MTNARHNAGFSLVEVMCAILILGVALVGLTEGLSTALVSSKESEVQTTAALLAAGQIETLRAESFVADGETEGEGQGALSRYRWRQAISSTSINGLHDVKVVVENSVSGKAIYELRTLLFDPPLTSESGDSVKKKDSRKSKKGEKKDQ